MLDRQQWQGLIRQQEEIKHLQGEIHLKSQLKLQIQKAVNKLSKDIRHQAELDFKIRAGNLKNGNGELQEIVNPQKGKLAKYPEEKGN